MSVTCKRSAVLKVPGVKPDQIAPLHALESSDWRIPEAQRVKVLSAKYESEYSTYTVELQIPLEGNTNSDKYGALEWRSKSALAEEIFEVLDILPPQYAGGPPEK